MKLAFPEFALDLNSPVAMGIVNVTPDSFSDGGRFLAVERAVQHGVQMASDGAALIDVGGESTRPGAEPVEEVEELRRVVPVIRELAAVAGVPVSIDTSKPVVMEAAAEAGAVMINDVNALRTDGALRVAVETGLAVCLMHMQGQPRQMQANPTYSDVVEEVYSFLSDRIEACLAAGMDLARIVIDPGFGFGKTLEHNLTLMRRLERFRDLGRPLLVGVSRKSMIGTILGRDVDERLWGSVVLGILAVERGANILRVHDVAPTMDAMRVMQAVSVSEDRQVVRKNG
ncbi:MAG: dihydropteroate synthase [Chromatiales bacterium]|jgi:dihydropteroate synthase|nr:dihydropteroate synthase [Chromatiales bacterium]